ncbi:sulfurtransferase [Aureivirga sp. CE67]|uniref:sulfurtransferase n=1 Tax=Aureivirga sp. CE67 TaxID=1788983 RepID=UPI0018C9B02C|nr:sulfurtransferase [Aureivirga sp. CE67]
MENTFFKSPVVTVDWLKENINNDKLILLNATISNPNAKNVEEDNLQIKESRFFDLGKKFSDTSSDLPHTMVSPEVFQEEARKIGINNDSILVVYDKLGVFSSPRVWWMFHAMRFKNIAVLDGGFPAWKKEGGETEEMELKEYPTGNFEAKYHYSSFCDKNYVKDTIDELMITTCDARPEGRFCGTTPEPRPGLRGGHIPNSVNIPFTSIIKDGKIVSKAELEKAFDGISKTHELIFSCGSGVTACILALAATILGYEDITVYDGSWSEWGIPSELPVVEGK